MRRRSAEVQGHVSCLSTNKYTICLLHSDSRGGGQRHSVSLHLAVQRFQQCCRQKWLVGHETRYDVYVACEGLKLKFQEIIGRAGLCITRTSLWESTASEINKPASRDNSSSGFKLNEPAAREAEWLTLLALEKRFKIMWQNRCWLHAPLLASIRFH